jgi:hypothetical protein
VNKAELIYEKVRSLPEPTQSAVLQMVEGMTDGAHVHASSLQEQAQLARTFQDLLESWRRETWFLSFIEQRVLHSAYQRIIGMGWGAVPLILRELEQRPDHLLWALQAITGEDPARHTRDLQAGVAAWLQWGRDRGLLSNAPAAGATTVTATLQA